MQTLIRVGCCARMRRGIPCSTIRGWNATRRVASIGQRRVQIQADGGRATWRAETMQFACDFSAAGFRRDAHIDIRREAQRQTRLRRRSKLHVADRNLACSLVAEGRSESPRGRLGVTSAGTDRQKVGLGRVRIGLIPTMEAMQLNAKECDTEEASMTVDLELVEVDLGESRLLDRSCCKSRSSGRRWWLPFPKACLMDAMLTA